VKSLRHVVTLLITLTLAAMLSGCSKNTTPTGLASLDQAAPAVPSQIVAHTADASGSPTLDWTPSSSANAASYEIYQYSPSPMNENAYVLVGEADAATPQYDMPWPNVRTTLYYRLCTVSSTGVKSALSAPVPATLGGQLPGSGSPDDRRDAPRDVPRGE
jgi:hypothetical protein